MSNLSKKSYMLIGMALLTLVLSVVVASPAQAQAYNSYPCAHPYVYPNGYYYCPVQATVSYNPAPVYTAPTYNYPQLTAYCNAQNGSSVPTGSSATWIAYASGGNGSYAYAWTGTDGLSGSGQTISMPYYGTGTKTASVTVYSGGQTATASCSGSVNVYNNNTYYNQPNYNYGYNTQYYQTLSATCQVNTTYADLGTSVTWSASAVGGTGYYNYSWSGTDGISGAGQAILYNYSTLGQKSAYVTVNSNGQTVTQPCQNSVTIGIPNGAVPNYIVGQPTTNGLDVGCFADPSTVSINQPITWSTEVTGGMAPYTYSWTGSDSLNGSQSSIIKYYGSAGEKSAIVTVTSSDGKTGTRACTNSVTVRRPASTGVTTAPVQPQVQQPQQQQSALPAASLFSLSNVPWGWVAVLVILVLFATVMYLLFNRPKI